MQASHVIGSFSPASLFTCQVMVGAKTVEDKMLSRFDSKFSKNLHSLLEKITDSGRLTHEHKLMNIVYRYFSQCVSMFSISSLP